MAKERGIQTVQALSLTGDWPAMIRDGGKCIETRKWATAYRGPLLICAAKSCPPPYAGQAVALAWLVDCRSMTKLDEADAACEVYEGAQAWVLAHVRAIDPFPVKGRQRLFAVEYTPPADWTAACLQAAGTPAATAEEPGATVAVPAELMERIRVAYRDRLAKAARVVSAKENLKFAKRLLDEAVDRLLKLDNELLGNQAWKDSPLGQAATAEEDGDEHEDDEDEDDEDLDDEGDAA